MMTWQNALNYINCLNANNYLGYSDWRMPNAAEMLSLGNYNVTDIAAWLNSQGYQNVQAAGYWTGTTDVNKADKAFTFDLATGEFTYHDKDTETYDVLPVRGGQLNGSTLELSATEHDFGQLIYSGLGQSETAAQVFTLGNTGTAPLQIVSMILSGTESAIFTIDPSAGTKSLRKHHAGHRGRRLLHLLCHLRSGLLGC